jgi:Tol biopolymer transport system component
MRRLILASAVATALISTLLTTPASATYIGREGKLVFVRANQIYTVANTGGAVTKLTTNGKNYRPKWSPDGKRIAYINEDTTGVKNVFVMSATGTGKTKVTNIGTVMGNSSWSPDGKQLAFAASYALYTIKATQPFGQPTARFGFNTGTSQDYDPPEIVPIEVDYGATLAWSPDGRSIGHESDGHDELSRSVDIYNLATGENHRVIATDGACCSYADVTDVNFGPTGVLSVSSNYDIGYYLGEDTRYEQRAVYPADGCTFDPFCVEPQTVPVFVSQLGDKGLVVSPTNKHVAFTNANSGTPNIYTATVTGKLRKMIVANGYQPDWQPLP